MDFRLVALDIDGTIRSQEHGISDRTRAAINAVGRAGATVTVATGRMFRSALASTEGLGLTSPIVSFQGAHVADPETGEVLWHRPLTANLVLAALEALEDWGSEIVASVGDDAYVNMMTPWAEGYNERNQGRIHVLDDLSEVAEMRPSRLFTVGDPSIIAELEARLKGTFGSKLHITRSLPTFCEILHPEGGKHNALQWLCDQLGIDRSQAIAFGNGYNDVDMLRWAGLGVAVGDALPEVLEAADMVAAPLVEDGAAQVLEQMLEEGRIG
ncbi:MAG: Cof-type HAD-IIB family hydrolase [SAR202 cluster bacterium]|nr:Cof-type HAD-IIB family hydrolase [SAR202 cluster bacterium]